MPELGYLNRLQEILSTEADKLPGGYSALAQHLRVTPQAVSKWLNGNFKEEISSGAAGAIAQYIGRDYESLQSYLRTGEWLPEEPQGPTAQEQIDALQQSLDDVKHQLEQLKKFPAVFRNDIAGKDFSMPNLSRAMQDALIDLGEDWREDETIRRLHGTFTRPKDEQGLGCRTPLMSVARLRAILFGQIEADEVDDPSLSQMMKAYTGDDFWSIFNVAALAEGRIIYTPPSQRNGFNGSSG